MAVKYKEISFKKGEKSLIDKKPIVDGQLLVGVEGVDKDGRNIASLYIDSTNPDSGNVERFSVGSSNIYVDGETILKDSNNKISANVAFFDTLAEAQAAVQARQVPDGAIIYIPGENGGGI